MIEENNFSNGKLPWLFEEKGETDIWEVSFYEKQMNLKLEMNLVPTTIKLVEYQLWWSQIITMLTISNHAHNFISLEWNRDDKENNDLLRATWYYKMEYIFHSS